MHGTWTDGLTDRPAERWIDGLTGWRLRRLGTSGRGDGEGGGLKGGGESRLEDGGLEGGGGDEGGGGFQHSALMAAFRGS